MSHIEATSCRLPLLDGETGTESQHKIIAFELEDTTILHDHGKGDVASLNGLLCTAWGLLLRCFTGQDSVAFQFRQSIIDNVNLTSGVPRIQQSGFQIAFQEHEPLSMCLAKAKDAYAGTEWGRASSVSEMSELRSSTAATHQNTYVHVQDTAHENTQDVVIQKGEIWLLTACTPRKVELSLKAYSCDVSAGYLRILAGTFQHLLIQIIVSSPERQLVDLDYISDHQKRQIDDWSTAPNERSNECVHHLIHERVMRNPGHKAVCAWDGSLTYQDLWTHVQRLARVLSSMGAGPEVIVPLCFEKSKWTTVAILAVLEAGAGFCLLDATQPISRLESLTRKLGARTLLCSRTHYQTLSSLVERVVVVDSESFKGLLGRPSDSITRASSSNIVYVVFTSGSTGEPKAIVIEHGAFCSAAKAQASALCIKPGLRALQYASYVFDASIQETLVPLMFGGTVCVPSEHSRINELAAAINQMRVEWAVLTPSVANFLTPTIVPQLQTLLLVGEVMSQENISTWSSVKLINAYGPAECSVASVANSDVSVNKEPTQIGRGIGVRCWLVDPQDHNRLIPPGCAAELVIEGPTLARGYLNDPQRTRDSFIESPPWAATSGSDSAGRRMYKTGDIVRYNTSNGMLHFVGRKDTQVKLHGQRIELGEIEHHLANEPAVSQSIVLMPKAGFCRQRLVAVISLKTMSITSRGTDAWTLQFLNKAEQEQTKSTVAMARESLSHRVPAFMNPPIWLVAQSIPILKSGKLDRKAVYNRVQDMSEETYSQWIQGGEKQETPVTELEVQLRSIWADVLNLRANQIGLKQSFLSLGGDSISAMMVQSRCKKNGTSITVQDILRAKSLCHLATFAGTVGQSAEEVEAIEEDFDLSPIQSLYFEYNDRKGHFNQSVFVRLTKVIQPRLLHQAIKTIINRHSMLRARFRMSAFEDEWKQRITTDVTGSYSFHVHECSLRQEAEPAMSKAQASLDPVNGPLFAMDLFNVEGSDQLLFMTAHHLVIDLVSWRVILQDLEELLTNPTLASEAQSSLSFQTWSKRQMEHAHKVPLNSVLPAIDIRQPSFAYWGLKEGDNTYGNVACEGFELDTLATAFITSQCHQALHTDTVDVLIAAMMHSFTQTFADRGHPTIFNESHGREPWDNSIDLSRTVGWFTAMFPIHVPSSDPIGFVDILKRVKDFRRAVSANGRSYFACRQLTSKGRKKFGSHWPLEFTFNYLGIYQQLEREDALLVPVKELAGEARGAGGNADVGHDTPRFGLFEISAVIAQGKLRFSFTFNRHMNHQEKIMAWISACREALTTLPPKLAKMEYGPTLSDYPLISMTYKGLQQLITDRLPQIGIPDIRYVEDIYRCSQIQQGLLISRQKDAGFYAIHGTYKVCPKDGVRVDSNRIASAWEKVVSRHPSLRTIFVESLSQEDALYDQIVLKHVNPTIVRLYCETDSDATQLLSSQRPMAHNQQRPSHRLTICETSMRQVFCKLELSHVIVDGASISIIFQDLVAFYEERLLPETGPLYSNYIAFLQSQPPQAGIGYWRSYLADIEPASFPVLNDAATRDRELHSKRIPIEDISAIQSFCNLQGVTMANIFHTAWALTLSCYTGSHDVCFGYLMSTRDDSIEGVEDLVGYLVNMLVCRVTFDSELPLITIMQQVQKDLSDGQVHRQTALSEVLHTLKLAGSSLFNTSLSYRKLPLETRHQRNAIAFEECCPYYDPTEYNVSINIEVAEESAVVDLDYWTDCLSDGHAINVASTFLNALDSIIDHSQLQVGQLRVVSESDRRQIAAWNSSMPETIEKCVHEVVGDQTILRPQAPAIKAWDGNFTYAELDAFTGRLAAYLSLFGVTTETYVCLCFEKSAYTIVGMLGVLKAGGAFVPLDPMYPMPAIEMRIKDTRARVVLTSSCYTAMFTGMGVHVVSIDQVFLDKLQPLQITQSSSAKPHNPCCAIYTSGSTGKPKGVVLEHRALVTSCNAHGSLLRIGQDTRFLQFASYTYDNNLEEIFTTLQLGGTVCVPSDHDRMNNLSGAVSRLGANFMSLTPTVATYLNPAEMPTVKTLALGGEAITKAVLDIWGGKVTIHNEYGPSECSINSTLRLNIEDSSDPSNIGHSVGSVSWVVDSSDHNRLVAIGREGELLIEGPILARGYLNNAEKTSQAFIKAPSWALDFETSGNRDSRRMYKTGDLVRYNSDGSICYVGRKDQQVKLHGQRIELGEIEHHIRIHLEADWQYAVELINPGNGPGSSKALALFACPQEDDCVPATVPENGLLPLSTMLLSVFKNLEASLTKALPKHMVPALYIPLARLPLTASGKLDRKKLHSHANSMTESQVAMFRLAGGSGREPSTEIEKTLACLWESVLRLGAGSIGMDAQFFRMGGDSVAAIRLVTAARSKGVSLTFADIFRNATLSKMSKNALFFDALGSGSAQDVPQPFALLPTTIPTDRIISEVADLCGITEASVEDIYPCTSIQEGLIALSTKQPGAYVAQNIYRLSSIDIPKFREAWETVVAAEGILRTRIVHTDSLGFLQVVVSESIEWSDLKCLDEVTATGRLKPAYNGAALTGYYMVENGAKDAYFVWTIHHALFDGWSSDLVLDKVQNQYQQSPNAKSVETIPYSAFIRYVSSVDPTASNNFWQSKFDGTSAPQFPMLPRPTYEPHVTNKYLHTVPLVRRPDMEVTTSSVIRAAWALTVSAYSNSDDVVFAETVTGRDSPVSGIVDMLGPTFATIPVRVQTRRDLTIAEYLNSLQDGFTEAMPYQHAGLQRIKRISSETAKACEFQNLITINTEAPDASKHFWQAENVETDVFFTYALTVSFDVGSTEVYMTAHYDPNILPEWLLSRLVRYFESVMTRLNSTNGVSLTLGDIRAIHDEDRASIQQWNRKPPVSVDECIHHLVLEKVQSLPQSAEAICSWDAHLTYKELDGWANSFSQHLRELGINYKSYVPICFEKSALTIVVMLAVLKVGAAFVAIDGESPKARLQSIVSDVEAKVILCSPKFEDVCDSLGPHTAVVDLKMVAGAAWENKPLPTCASSDVAYIVFTSGSTGKPKGTLVPHGAFVSGALAHGPAMRMSSTSRVLQFASYTFDASIVEIFTTLILGGCISVPDDKARLNDPTKVINDMKVNWALLTPSFAQMISPTDVPGLETLVLGGEAMSQNHLSIWAEHTHLINAYGPSECAVVATVNNHVSSTSSPSSIGRAVGGRCFIADQYDPNELVPIGAIGELLVEGPILARGYLKEPLKTEQAFIRNPKWIQDFYPDQSSAAHMVYRTGDLVKYVEDGSILYLGRKDSQAKLHGQRLELGEVEHHLGQVPTLQHALAVIPSRGIFENKLVAVLSFKEILDPCMTHDALQLVGRKEAEPYVRSMRSYVCSRLPPYMVPSNWITLQDIPLLPSGKLDRRRMMTLVEDIPETVHRELSETESENAIVQGSEVEQRLQLVWSKILHLPVEQIGLDKNFLYLGGDSISALQVASQCRTEGLGVTVQDIMRSQSVSHLAERVTLPRSAEYGDEEYDKPFDLSPIQRLFFDWVGDDVNHFNQSIMLKLAHRRDVDKVAAAVKALVNSHSMLRAHFERQTGSGWVQRLDKEVSSSCRFTAHPGRFSSGRITSVVEQTQKSLDIQHGLVFAVDLFDFEEGDSQVLSIVVHHLVIDVVSWGIMLEDLEALLVQGKVTAQPSLPFQIWSRLQNEHSLSKLPSEMQIYSEIPVADYAYWGMLDKTNTYGAEQSIDFQLDAETTAKLLGPCQLPFQTELVDVLLGSILYSFRQSFPDRESVPTIFNEAHGREPWDSNFDLTRTVGWFTTISPVFLPAEATQELDITKIIRWIKDQRSRNTGKGREYFSYRMLTEKGRVSSVDHWPMEIAFNYLGQEKQFKRSGALLQPLDEVSTGSDIGATVSRFALFEISASIVGDALKLSINYSSGVQRQAGIKLWASELERALHYSSQRLLALETQPTLSNFPLLPLCYSAIEILQTRLPSLGVPSLADLQDVHGCSPMQQGLLLSQIKNTGQYMYQSIFSVSFADLANPIATLRLSRAWEIVVERHSMLRTVFMESVSREGLMDQAVLKKISPRVVLLKSETAMAVALLRKQKPLGLADLQPHHQLTICQEAGDAVFCKLEMSHALCDGTSIPIIIRDLAKAYIEQPSRAKEAMRYSQYISHIQQTSRDEDVAYWRRYLDNVEPCYFPALADGRKNERELRTLELELEDTPQLHSFCAQKSVTLSNVLQLVWSLVLRAYTGTENVCFGYLSSGRDAPLDGIQDAVGLFISMLVCRIDLSKDLPVDSALKQIQEDYTQSMAHQAFSLGDMQHELQLSGKSLFNTAFTFQRRSDGKNEKAQQQLKFDVVEAYDPSEYNVTVNVESHENDTVVHFNYWTDFFSDAQATNVSDTFGQVLRSIIRPEPSQQTIGALEFCSETHKSQVFEWNQEPLPLTDQCVHDLISHQSQSLPPKTPAICSWDGELTYTELMSLAGGLSRHLAALGVGPEVYVPICFEKTSWAIVAMLGVLLAGGAFVPLEPTHPDSRIKFIVEDVRARLILTSSKHMEKFSNLAEVKALVVDGGLGSQAGPSKETDISVPNPDNAAYLIFTSGTTGLPKGTIVSHRAFATGATKHAPEILMTKTSRVLQFSNLCFDASIMEILTSLIIGACVCIPSNEERMNNISGAINRMSVSWTLLTPSVAKVLKPEKVPSLKVFVTGGEAMQAGHIAKWVGKACVVNAYGPSECAVIATTSIKADEQGHVLNDDPAVIGRAVGCRSWVVDPQDHGRLMPIGSVGELVLQGNTVARGYLNNEEKTQRAFVASPSWMPSDVHGMTGGSVKMIYKTGDLVRYNSDGTIVYISRKDSQVKLNGLRIELGEIEHHVKQNIPSDLQAAVEMVAPAGQRPLLAMFFASSDHDTRSKHVPADKDPLLLQISDAAISLCKALKASLAGVIPAYMIPSLFIPLSQMPWTASGKLDRSRLAKIVLSLSKEDTVPFRLASTSDKRDPATNMEKKLRSLWETVLSLESATATLDDSFFVLGGDSVQAMRLVAAARAEKISLSVLDIFRTPSLSEMAKACSTLEEEDQIVLKQFGLLADVEILDQLLDEIVTQCRVEKEELADAYPCSALQEGLITLSIKQPGAYVAHNVFRLPEAVDIGQFKTAWEKAVADMDILRTRIVHTSMSTFVQVVLRQEKVQWYGAGRTEDATNAALQLPEHSGSPLMRFTIVDNNDGERYFVWSIHHALYDGWSMPRMLQRVEDIYFEESCPPHKAPYSHFIKYLKGTDSQASDRYWRSKFDGLQSLHFPKVLSLDADEDAQAETLKYTVRLPEMSKGTGFTLPTMIRAGWAILLSAQTGSEDVIFGETMTGRDVPVDGIIDMLGPTLTTVPTRIQVNSSLTIMEYLQKINQMAADIIPHQHVGLQNIRRLNSDTATACDFQNLLVIQTAGAGGDSKMWDPVNSGVGSNFFTYPLVVECTAGASSIHIDAHYNENVISKWHVERLVRQLESILGQICSATPTNDAKLSDVQVISEEDIEAIRSWNSYQPTVVKKCIHDLFLQQAVLKPQSLAVHAWDGDFTYTELKNQAGRLSNHLKQLGVAPEILVPFCTDKSRWALVAQLGVLMAGGGIVPLDPAHPLTRHSEIIQDTRATILLCSPAYQDRYTSLVQTVIPIDEKSLSPIYNPASRKPSTSQAHGKSTAYVIFTSGSTGRPKGVVIEHQAFCTSSMAYCGSMLMTSTSRVFNFASVTFDVGLMENLSPLTIGACVCMPNNEAKTKDTAATIDVLGANWAFLTPSVANLIDPARVPSLKTLVCGGEAMSKENIIKWADSVTLVNGYGPTEASVICVANGQVSRDKDPSNIGYAHSNCYAWITEPGNHNRLAPLGCSGELLMEGPILAREYLHDTAKTEAAFIKDPVWARRFSDKVSTPGRCFYKTGDLVKYNADGSIGFIGRKDNQIKLHGQRIELGEIEHNIELHDKVQHAVALLPKAGVCKARLVAVLALCDLCAGSAASKAENCELLSGEDRMKTAQAQLKDVRDFLSNVIPTYMMPAVWVPVEAIPIMVSGKLDRKKVERWIESLDQATYRQITSHEDTTYDAAPITETVQQLREIWASVFNFPIDKIDPGQSFMGQGGDSLISMTIIARCQKIGIVLSLQEVLQSKSLFQLAGLVDSRGQSSITVKATFHEERTDQLFDLSPVQRMYFQLAGPDSDHTRDGRFNQSQLLRIKRKTEPKTLRNAVEIIVQQHSMFRARFSQNRTGSWQQRISPLAAGSYRFREHWVQHLGQILPLLADSQTSLDIEHGPLFAVELFNTDQHGQILSLVAHHLIVDVVSWNILLPQLEDLLTSSVETIDKPLSFQVWCGSQNDHASQRDAAHVKNILPFNIKKANMAFWGMTDRANTYADVKHESFLLDRSTSQLALGKANKALRTQPVEIFQTALIHSFRNLFPQRAAPTVFNESHGRDGWDTSVDPTGTMGWFTSIYPLHVAAESETASAFELLKRVKDLRRSVPANGREYFAHRYLTADGRWRFGDHMPMEILLNYTGQSHQDEQSDSLFLPFELAKSEEDQILTADVGPKATRMALFEISVAATNDQIGFSFMYNQYMQHQEEIRKLVMVCRDTLKSLVQEIANAKPEPTLSDYPLLPTNYNGLQKHATDTFREVGISSLDEVEDMYVTAPTQDGLLLSQIRNPDQYVNYVISEVQLAQQSTTRIDPQRLARAWQKVVDRHQSLRTVFVYSVCKGHAFDQIALKHADGGAKIVRCEDSEFEKELGKVSLREVNRVRRPMLPHQLTICTTTSGRCYTKLELNHAVIDGGSGALITRDLGLAYQGNLPDGPKPLYSDYVRYISSLSAGAGVTFWKTYLNGIQRCHLPTLNPTLGAPKRLNAIYLHFHRFPEMQAFCRANSFTLSNVMLAAWGLVLRQYTSMEDVCFGNLTAGRDAPVDGIQDSVGAFINMLVCRVNFSQPSSLKGIIRNVQNEYLESLPHQHCSLAKLQHDLGLSGEPLFNTAVSIQNQISTRDAEKEGDAIEIEPLSDHDPTEYAITVNIRSAPRDEGARIKHWTTHVSVEEGEKLTRTYADVLGAILDHADQTVSQMENAANKTLDVVTVKEPSLTDKPQPQNNDQIVPVEKAQAKSGASLGKDFSRRPMLPRQRTREIIKATIVETIDEMPKRPDLPRQRTRDIIMAAVGETIDQLKKSGSLVRRVSNSTNLSDIVGRQIHSRNTSNAKTTDAKDIVSSKEPKETRKSSRYEAEPPEEICNLLRSLWSSLLDILEEHIRGESSFFGLGGDSILAMELARDAREHELTLTVADIFGSPTFSEMAKVLASSARRKQERIDGAQAAMISEIRDELVTTKPEDSHFSLVDSTNTEAFIQDYICPKIGVFRGGIVDAFPVTDFQALAVAGTLKECRWMLNYFTFDGSGFLDLERLRRSVSKLVQQFDILRTVFIPCGNRFFQVQLRHVRPQLQVYHTEEDFGDYTQHLRDHSPDASPKLGEPYVQLIVLRRPGSHAHRIILRMSHAQYDGVCLPRIMDAFQAGYEGRPLPPAPVQFAKYVLEGSGNASSGHYDYWKSLLQGSSMTSIVHREQPKYSASELKSKTLKRIINLPALTTNTITTATILKAAWTSALAQLSGRSDIVFGNLISGRNVAVEGVESIVGPCLNILPVRITLDPTWTALDIMRRIQNQQVAGMPFESLGFREIVQHCTDWPEWTYFPTLVQHQNLAQDAGLTLDRTKYKVGCLGAQDTLADITVVSTPKANDMVEVCMSFIDDGSIVPKFVDTALDLLCSLAQSFATNPTHVLPSIYSASSSRPLTHQHSDILKEEPPLLEPMLRGLKKRDVSDLADMLTRAWRMVLPATKQHSVALNLYSSFYELGGDLIGLASLTAFLEGEGFDVRLEDMIKRPTLGEQVALLSTKKDLESVERVSTSTRQSAEADGTPVQEQQGGAKRRMSLQKRAGRTVLNKSLRMARRVGAGRARDV